jgi:hypothetical protein
MYVEWRGRITHDEHGHEIVALKLEGPQGYFALCTLVGMPGILCAHDSNPYTLAALDAGGDMR